MKQCISYNQEKKCYILTTAKDAYTITKENYEKPIGSGQYGKVYLATQSTSKYAIKIISKNTDIPMQKIQEEISIMKEALNYEGSAHLMYAIDSIEDSQNFYVVMPYFDKGSLTQLLTNYQIEDELEAMEYFRQICYGVMLMHKNKIIHRDLKADNIMVTSYSDPCYAYKYNFAVSDFGLSKHVEEYLNMTVGVGTPLTKAPEVFTTHYNGLTDIYSLGCILYYILTLRYPFEGETVKQVEEVKESTEVLEVIPVFKNKEVRLSNLTLKILEGCMQMSRDLRYTMEDLICALDLTNLYSNYTALILGEPSISNIINVRDFKRKVYYSPLKSILNSTKQSFIADDSCIRNSINKQLYNIPLQSNGSQCRAQLSRDDLCNSIVKPPSSTMLLKEGIHITNIPYISSFSEDDISVDFPIIKSKDQCEIVRYITSVINGYLSYPKTIKDELAKSLALEGTEYTLIPLKAISMTRLVAKIIYYCLTQSHLVAKNNIIEVRVEVSNYKASMLLGYLLDQLCSSNDKAILKMAAEMLIKFSKSQDIVLPFVYTVRASYNQMVIEIPAPTS